MNDEPYRTRSGRPLTGAELEDLAAEAERGYDVDELLARRDATVAAFETPDLPTSWEMFGMRTERGVWVALGSRDHVRAHGCADPTPVRLVEDPEGDYLGWVRAGRTDPFMVQRREIYEVQFPYGSRAEEERGGGRTVRLRIEEVA